MLPVTCPFHPNFIQTFMSFSSFALCTRSEDARKCLRVHTSVPRSHRTRNGICRHACHPFLWVTVPGTSQQERTQVQFCCLCAKANASNRTHIHSPGHSSAFIPTDLMCVRIPKRGCVRVRTRRRERCPSCCSTAKCSEDPSKPILCLEVNADCFACIVYF